jgi:Cu-Zn family superoxide dismutase
MRRFTMVFGLIATSTLAAGCASLFHKTAPVAQATVANASGANLGVLNFTPTSSGVHITGELKSLTAGQHGIHIHTVGKCEAPGFTTAGAHFNPASAKHGLQNSAGPHAGDMENITVGADGEVDVDLTTPRITLDAAANTGVFDADGAAIVVHAAADDQKTDPSGNSGARIACGIIRKL